MTKMKKLLCLLLCLFLCGCSKTETESRDSVTLWYVQGQEPKGLERLVVEYNAQRAKGSLPVSLRSFPHEQGLAAAFEQLRPDLLICDQKKAEHLYSAELLQKLSLANPNYSEGIKAAFEYEGECYFPIGCSLQLLAEREALFDKTQLESLEQFCSAAMAYSREKGEPVFRADSFSALFCDALLAMDTEFHADIAQDKNNERFRYLYNMLTECVMEGALLSSAYSSADILASRALPYALADSASLVDLEGLNVYPSPGFQRSLDYTGSCVGIAVTALGGRDMNSITEFINYVNQNSPRLALKSGLAPAVLSDAQGENSLEKCILEIGAYYNPCFPVENSDYEKNRLSFEAVFRNTINRLY